MRTAKNPYRSDCFHTISFILQGLNIKSLICKGLNRCFSRAISKIFNNSRSLGTDSPSLGTDFSSLSTDSPPLSTELLIFRLLFMANVFKDIANLLLYHTQ